MAVTDICFEVGYNNLSNFNRHFRIEMNQTPSDYRRGVVSGSPHPDTQPRSTSPR
jgi:AraC-like DNA-binding protein